MFGALLLVLSSLAADKLQLPGTAEQQKAVDAVREIYGDQWRAATTAQEKTALVRKLIADADGTKDDAAGRFVLLRTARDMAAQIGDVALVREACEKLEAAFHVGDMRTEALKALGKSVRGRDGYTALTELALDSLARDIEAERFDSAEACLSAAEESVRRTGNSTLARRVADERKKLDAQAEAWAKAEEARKVLEDSATDPEANEVVGRYLCFVRGDWERGLPHLALATDSQLVTRAADDLKRPTDPEAQVALGDAWWDLDEGRERGAFWYRKALPKLTGLAKARVEKRLQELREESPVAGYQPGLLKFEFDPQEGVSGFIEPWKLGKPNGEPEIIQKVAPFHYKGGKHAVAVGYLKIDVPGVYKFQTYNYYDRNALYVGGKLVCPYMVRDDSKELIPLRKGYVPFLLIGYADAKGSVETMTWHVPGTPKAVPIPDEALFHDAEVYRWMEKK